MPARPAQTGIFFVVRSPYSRSAQFLRQHVDDAEALKRLLARLRQSGRDVAKEAGRLGTLKDPDDEWLTGKLTPLTVAAYFGYEAIVKLLAHRPRKLRQEVQRRLAEPVQPERRECGIAQVLVVNAALTAFIWFCVQTCASIKNAPTARRADGGRCLQNQQMPAHSWAGPRQTAAG